MRTPSERWLIDTNVWIFGLRRDEKFPDSVRLLQRLGSFTALIPLQVIKELHVNLTDREMTEFHGLLNGFPNRAELNWEEPSSERVAFYRKAGCRKGDAIIAASAEVLACDLIISNNRQFLRAISDLPADIVTPAQALASWVLSMSISDAQERHALLPTAEELAVLSPFERFAFRFTHRMNLGKWKRFWTWCQSFFGAGWIHISTYNLMRVYGLEHVAAVDHSRPLLIVANHRSFFDMYVVSTTLFRKTPWRKQLFFPVRGRFYYQNPLGMFVNLIMGWWSMYPPFFLSGSKPIPEKRDFDKYSFRRLVQLCSEGAGNVIGFHPEGTRNKNDDPYSYLRAQPGVGKLIKDANPQVIPVFIAGLGNNLPKQVLGNWFGGPKIRIHFGKQLDLAEFIAKKDHVRTYKEIGEFVMSKIAELGEADRKLMQDPES